MRAVKYRVVIFLRLTVDLHARRSTTARISIATEDPQYHHLVHDLGPHPTLVHAPLLVLHHALSPCLHTTLLREETEQSDV